MEIKWKNDDDCDIRMGAELHNVNVFTQTKIVGSKFTPKTRKLRLICFRDKMRKILICVLILQFKGSYASFNSKYLHRPT